MIKYESIVDSQQIAARIVSFKNDTSLRLFSMHWHHGTELLYCRKGKLEIRIRDANFQMEQGDLIYVNSNIPHETRSKEPNDVIMIQFKELFYDESEVIVDLNTKRKSIEKTIKKELIALLENIEHINKEKELYYELRINSELYQLKYLLLKHFGKENTYPTPDKDVVKAVEGSLHFIEENYKLMIDVSDVAKNSGYSLSYFSRSFKSFLGTSCWNYIQNRRLQAALKLLRDDRNKPILDIAFESGFPNIKSLRVALYNDSGMTPSEYRNNLK